MQVACLKNRKEEKMNTVNIIGRLTRDPELISTQSGVSLCKFSVAVDRKFKNANGERETDFFNVQAWRNTAEFIAQYFSKGQRIGIVGRLETSRWTDSETGQNRNNTYIVADEAHFADSKQSNNHNNQQQQEYGFREHLDDLFSEDIAELPFEL